jgi:asparaginyl-tRNA synthetase
MLEAEQAFTSRGMDEIMDLAEDMLRYMTTRIYESQVGREMIASKEAHPADTPDAHVSAATLAGRYQGVMAGPWPRITYTACIALLQASGKQFEFPVEWGASLQAEHERYIAAAVGGGGPVFVTHYPARFKAFYMLSSSAPPAEGQTVDCFDLLVPDFCEVAGGSMREHRLPELLGAMHRHGLTRGDMSGKNYFGPEVAKELGGMKWYTDLRYWGTVPHGGFGVGFDRFLGYLSGVPNIREVVAFPRWVGRCDC